MKLQIPFAGRRQCDRRVPLLSYQPMQERRCRQKWNRSARLSKPETSTQTDSQALSLYGRHKQTKKFSRLLNRWQKTTAKDRRFIIWFPLSKMEQSKPLKRCSSNYKGTFEQSEARRCGGSTLPNTTPRSQWTKLRQVLKRVRPDPRPTVASCLKRTGQRHFKTLSMTYWHHHHDNAMPPNPYHQRSIEVESTRCPWTAAHGCCLRDLRPEVMDDLLSVVKTGQVSTDVADQPLNAVQKTREN